VQVITNLISNACKFSPAGDEVEVRLQRRGDAVALSVSDRGPGVPIELRPRLFERFAQLDSSDSRRRAGTGLGLNICRGIIERLGGRIGYRPREGGGSIFEFTLPAAKSSGEKP
jgi:signal transduction histidine kinase